ARRSRRAARRAAAPPPPCRPGATSPSWWSERQYGPRRERVLVAEDADGDVSPAGEGTSVPWPGRRVDLYRSSHLRHGRSRRAHPSGKGARGTMAEPTTWTVSPFISEVQPISAKIGRASCREQGAECVAREA